MSIRVSNLQLPVEVPEAELPERLTKALGISASELSRWRIVRKALDLRDKRQLRFVYNFDVDLTANEGAVVARASTFVTTGIAGSLKFNSSRSRANRSYAGFISAQ